MCQGSSKYGEHSYRPQTHGDKHVPDSAEIVLVSCYNLGAEWSLKACLFKVFSPAGSAAEGC